MIHEPTDTMFSSSPERSPENFLAHFHRVPDPRLDRKKLYSLPEIFFLCIAAVCCGCVGPSEVADFGKDRIDWLRKYLPYTEGTPSHDTIGRVLSIVRPEAFEAAFLSWIAEFFPESVVATTAVTRQIAIDGKSLRGSAQPSKGARALHLLGAWSTTHRLLLGQTAVDQKSNEITAIPELLRSLELRGALVSIDAMGCQTEIAETIAEGKGDYLLHAKRNQPGLYDQIVDAFDELHETDVLPGDRFLHQSRDQGHGRQEERSTYLLALPPEMKETAKNWSKLRSIAQCTSVVQRDGRESVQTRYYITSLPPTAVHRVATAIRSHWDIENGLHWELDVSMGEDAATLHDRIAAQNLAMVRRFALSLIKQEPSSGSNKGKLKRANRNTKLLESILFGPV